MSYMNDYDKLLRDIESSGQNWSEWDLRLAQNNPDAGRSIYTQKQNYANAQTDAERKAANDAAEMIRSKYGGYTGGKTGSGYTLAQERAPAYTEYASKYSDQIDSLMQEILGREKFSYNPSSDPSYQAYSEKYRNLGNQARKDVMADAAAMTGGQVNSYAIAAGQQAQDSYNAQMTDVIPALQQLAYEMYLGDLDQKRADLSALTALDETAYGRHQDSYDRSLDKWQLDYGVDRDMISDQRYEDETAYARNLEKAQTLAAAGDFSGYKALGYSDAEIRLMQAAYGMGSGGGGDEDYYEPGREMDTEVDRDDYEVTNSTHEWENDPDKGRIIVGDQLLFRDDFYRMLSNGEIRAEYDDEKKTVTYFLTR